MKIAARALVALAAISFLPACRTTAPATKTPLVSESLAPSPRLIVGRVVAVDTARRFAFVELATDAPPAATTADTELITRTLDLRETGRLRASRQLRGRTLGTLILSGRPNAGDEVVWLAP
ncbi:MAG: hypothetical protein V4773_09260 [Verrucomicrobiota bacterium]